MNIKNSKKIYRLNYLKLSDNSKIIGYGYLGSDNLLHDVFTGNIIQTETNMVYMNPNIGLIATDLEEIDYNYLECCFNDILMVEYANVSKKINKLTKENFIYICENQDSLIEIHEIIEKYLKKSKKSH